MNRPILALVVLAFATPTYAEDAKERLDDAFDAIEPKVIAWRRDFHQHPELSNREFRTAGKVAEHLQSLD
ncbi:MAG: amidohydrolase, partial [Woeseiaceae bacterium]